METSQTHSAKSDGLFFLVCQPPARHSLPNPMPDLKFRGLRRRMISLLTRGSIFNYSPRSALAAANGATRDDPTIAFAQPALHRHVAHP
jgi:hypothetical protein